MPLSLKSNLLTVRPERSLKDRAKKNISPGIPTLKLEDNRIESQITDRQLVFSVSSREHNSKRKTLFSAQGSRALLRQAKMIDPKDPALTFLPPKQPKTKLHSPVDKKKEPRKLSDDDFDLPPFKIFRRGIKSNQIR